MDTSYGQKRSQVSFEMLDWRIGFKKNLIQYSNNAMDQKARKVLLFLQSVKDEGPIEGAWEDDGYRDASQLKRTMLWI